jgi:hypothetical protein
MSNSSLIIIFLILISSLSLKKVDVKLTGNWKIDYLIVENDTLFQSENINATIRFYNKKMSGWSKTKDDSDYIAKCIRSTYTDLKGVTLSFNRKNYTRSFINACWDNINLSRIDNGSYKKLDDTLYLFDTNQKVDMQLMYTNLNDKLRYVNPEYNYEIVFNRVSIK